MTATGGAVFSSSTATLTLSNFKLTKAQDASNVTVGFDSTMGSVTAAGSAISDGVVLEGITPSEGVALTADPASGYDFACWVNAADNSILSYDASYTLQPEGDIAVKAMFYKIGVDAYFSINKILYRSLNEALQVAQTGDVVMLANNGTLVAGDYTIPSGITLLIPFNEGGAVYTTVPASTSATTAPSAYRTLTMAEGANLIINGVMSVPAKHYRSSGRPVKKYGYVVLQKGSSIKVNGALYAYGFISGQGTVKIMSGASVYEYFQIIDFRGGTATLNMYNNSNEVFPLSQYYVQNVEAPMTLEAGASEYGYTTLYMSSTEYHSTVKFIGTSGAMFNLTSGSVTKQYDGTTDRLNIKANGTMSLDPMSLTVSSMSINSRDYVLPLNSSITIEVEGGTATINQDIALQPDTKLIIRERAKCVLASGVRLYVYDFDQWGNYVYSNTTLRVVPYAAGRTYKSATSSSRKVTGDAVIQVAGTLDASAGKLYTTESGAAITGVEGGTVKMSSVSAGSTYQATQSGSSISYATIAVTSAKLCNSGGDYVSTSANTYAYEEGTWAVQCEHNYSTARTEATCTADGSITHTCSKCGRTRYETIPATGHSWNDGEITTPADCETAGVMTFTCSGCGEQNAEQIDALGHDMVYTSVKEATCTEAGESASAYCGRCDYVEVSGSIIPALGHDWSVTSRVEVTCTTDGSISYDCSRCDETKVETTEATGHQYSSVVAEPSCTEGGYTSNMCEVCGVAYITDETAPLGHDRGDDQTDIHSFTCVNCGEAITEDHDFTHGDVCICGLGTARNSATGTLYCTVTEALAAAEAGQTVIMQGDSAENRILVRPGVTLDLNGRTLTAEYVVGFNTSKICDSSVCADNGYVAEGLLTVNADNMVLYEGNGAAPVYNPEKGGYIFVDFLFNSKIVEKDDGVYLNMLVTSRTMEVIDLLKDGAGDNDVQVVVRLTWDNETGTAYQDFVFNETTVQNVMSSNDGTYNGFGSMFYVKITGLKGMTGVTCTVMVISGTNVADLGKTVTLGENA